MLGHHADLVGDQVGAVEADAELADPDPVVGVPKTIGENIQAIFGSLHTKDAII